MIDLHLHLDGSLNPKNIFTMAKMAGVSLPFSSEDEIRARMSVEPDCRSLAEYLERFSLPLSLLQTAECIEYAVYELIRELNEQGLVYAEIRFAPQLHRECGLTQSEAVIAALRGRERGRQDFGMLTNLILCCMRGDENKDENLETVAVARQFLGRGVCAIDLAGNEAAYPTVSFSEIFALAKGASVPVIIHAGEAAGAESVWQALELGAVRIGHGIHAKEDDELIDELCDKGICLEMCYSSNLQTKAVMGDEDYPLVGFLDKGLRVTLNTDNLTVSGTDLQNEYRLVKKTFGLSDGRLLCIALNALDAAFITEAERKKFKRRIEKDFSLWLNRKA